VVRTDLTKDTNFKFLFVTPERVVQSTRFFSFLSGQVNAGRLARCVAQSSSSYALSGAS
jgi:hypothetical protein